MSIIEQALERMRRTDGATPTPMRAPPTTLIGRQRGVPTTARAAEAEPPRLPPRKSVDIDWSVLASAGTLPPPEQERQILGQFRKIKRPLIRRAFEHDPKYPRNPRLIMIASALPGEGKTFSTVNLALSMARERDTEVLVIDADVAKPQLSSLFGVSNEPGLMDALLDASIDPSGLVIATDVERLHVLSAGQVRDDTATELLSSARMREIVERIATAWPNVIVLFDSPPLLLTTEAHALANIVGQIMLVVRAGVTERHAVQEALELLPEGTETGLVLNQSHSGHSDGYGNYSAYYGQYPAPGTKD